VGAMSWQGRGRFGVCGGFGAGSSIHRPSVAFGARRASAPARRPAVARVGRLTRAVVATSGRLDGLLGGCGALLRYALPEGAPLENVPKQPRSVCGTFSRTARPPFPALRCSAQYGILGPSGAREGAQRRCVAVGARGCGARRPPVALRFNAQRNFFRRRLASATRAAEDQQAGVPGSHASDTLEGPTSARGSQIWNHEGAATERRTWHPCQETLARWVSPFSPLSRCLAFSHLSSRRAARRYSKPLPWLATSLAECRKPRCKDAVNKPAASVRDRLTPQAVWVGLRVIHRSDS
jgi:hypothetical protein